MKTKLAILAAAIALFILSVQLTNPEKLKPVTVFKPGTVVGTMNLSRTPWDVGYANLNSRLTTPFYVNLESKSRGVTPEELGITLDRDKLTKLTSTCRTRLLRLFCRNTSNEKIDGNKIFNVNNEKLDAFLQELNNDVAFLSENNVISFEDNTFRALSPEASVNIDPSTFESYESLASIITTDNFVIDLKIVSEDNLDLQKEATKDLIADITMPLLIKYGRNPIRIPVEDMENFIESIEKEGYLFGQVNSNEIGKYIDKLNVAYANEDIVVSKKDAVEAIARGILFRAANYEINNAVILPLDGKPKTQGELHSEYLELVKSQQRLYKFKNGALVKTYVVSTGLTWETPAGEFEILGKQKMTISYYDSWYMPNYLPVGTIDGYFFGFHEIPYHMDAAGNIYSRDANTMGSPATGGCIQLKADDSLEIFDNTPIGTPVYIYE